MSTNELFLLDRFLSKKQQESSHLTPDKFFELFVCEQILQDYHLSPDEVDAGIVGGGNDGGIDGIFTFIDGKLLSEDSDLNPENHREHSNLTLILVQAKRRRSFTETTLDKVSSSMDRLLELNPETQPNLDELYSPEVIERIALFRQAVTDLMETFPKVHITFYYATRGDANEINQKVHIKGEALEEKFKEFLTGTTAEISFLGAAELWNLAKQRPHYTLKLKSEDSVTIGNSHVAVVTLRDYMEFLTGEYGNLRRHIFDSNVRDFEGGVEVNKDIRSSLEGSSGPDFWWLNNGVTIVCAAASSHARTFTLRDVQIVNGLQTSYTIYDVLSEKPAEDPVFDQKLLVRILETNDRATAVRVIRATNRQTRVSDASLRATEDIHGHIEDYFKDHQWYYERRKNYYRNQGMPRDRTVSITYLAQTVMAIGLSRPDHARARPTSLVKDDRHYASIFSQRIPLNVYLWTVRVQRYVDAFFHSHMENATERTNLRFHLSMLATARLFGGRVRNPKQLLTLADSNPILSEDNLLSCLETLRNVIREMGEDQNVTPDKIAKRLEFVEKVLAVEGFY